jgi:outer membrane protein assembly factor BamB
LSKHPDLGVPIGASIDGHGDDFARTATVLSNGAQRVLLAAVDGRTGRAHWQRELPVTSAANLTDVWTGDFRGTGRADLLDVLIEPDRAVVVVQDGRAGRTTWSGDYDTQDPFFEFE